MDSKIYKEIESTAAYHPPAAYGLGSGSPLSLLTFWDDIKVEPDVLSSGFIPLSAVAQQARNPKLFVVGIIPPSANVTGRLLDRSATVAQEVGLDERSDAVMAAAGAQFLSIPDHYHRSESKIEELHFSIQPLAQMLIVAAAAEGIQLVVAEGVRTLERQEEVYNQGRSAPGAVVSNAPPGESYHNFGLAFDVALLINGKVSYSEKDPTLWPRIGAIGESIGLQWGGRFSNKDNPHFEYHPGLRIHDIQAGRYPKVPQFVPIPAPVRPVEGDAGSGPWDKESSDKAKAAGKQIERSAATPLNSTEAGRAYQMAQRTQVLRTLAALESMRNTPPLRLLVNPQRFATSDTKIASDGNWGRNGPIIEYWGDEPTKVSASGKVAAFYAMDATNADGPGLTRTARNFSQSWQNFQSLFLIYKNNGCMYLQDPTQAGPSKNLSLVGSVYIYYDNILYVGSFDSFSISETDSSPFTAEYNFEFSVRAAFMLDREPDDVPDYTRTLNVEERL